MNRNKIKDVQGKNEFEQDFNVLTQFALPGFTILSYLLVAMKHPEFGLVLNLSANKLSVKFANFHHNLLKNFNQY